MHQSNFNVIPLFPIPLIDFKLMEFSNDVEKTFCLMSDDDWEEINSWNIISKNKFVLNSDKELLDKFNQVSNALICTLIRSSIKTQITTSWFTKTPSNERGNQHSHTNSWWSGVYYFRNDTSAIKFEQFDRGVHVPYENNEPNEFNTSAFTLKPEKGTLILFPSYLIHSIQKNESSSNRHSLAFNIMPKGEVGVQDSWFEY